MRKDSEDLVSSANFKSGIILEIGHKILNFSACLQLNV